MSPNYPADTNKLLLPPASPQSREADTQVTQQSDLPVPANEEREKQERHTLKILLTLLLIICLYSLGSLSLAPHLLPASLLSTLFTPAPGAIGGGTCTATPADLHYLPMPPDQPSSPQLPAIWSQHGFNNDDLAAAQACAGSFVVAYQSFDFNQIKTFEASTSMLSIGAQQRFEGHAAGSQPDIRLDPFWRASIQKQQIRQSAQVTLPGFLNAQLTNNRMLVWFQVRYHLNILRNSEKLTREDTLTVLVASVPSNKQVKWQISAWKDGISIFPALNPL